MEWARLQRDSPMVKRIQVLPSGHDRSAEIPGHGLCSNIGLCQNSREETRLEVGVISGFFRGEGAMKLLLTGLGILTMIPLIVIATFLGLPGGLALAAQSPQITHVSIVPGAAQLTTTAYSPDVVTVVIGVNNTVAWTNNDNVVHSVAGANSSHFITYAIDPGSTTSYTFSAPGTYPYYCIQHPSMEGTVIVKAGAVVTTTTSSTSSTTSESTSTTTSSTSSATTSRSSSTSSSIVQLTSTTSAAAPSLGGLPTTTILAGVAAVVVIAVVGFFLLRRRR